jgi:Rieske Fe-S protein
VMAAVYIYNALAAARQAVYGQRVGAVADFPPSTAPYAVGTPDAPTLFIVNTGEALVAFAPYETGGKEHCPIRWDPARGIFAGSCLGAKYTLDGAWCDGPARRDLDQYPVWVMEAEVWVNPERVLTGEATNIVKTPSGAAGPGCPQSAETEN